MPELDEVFHHLHHRLRVAERARRVHLRVELGEREKRGGRSVGRIPWHRCRGEGEHALVLVRIEERVDLMRMLLVLLREAEDLDRITGFAGGGERSFEDGHEIQPGEGDDDRQPARPARAHRAGGEVGAVVDLGGGLEDPLPGRGRDAAAPGEHQ
nr:hypothetical protein GCM10025732_30080 [Glycomyces mayteni]